MKVFSQIISYCVRSDLAVSLISNFNENYKFLDKSEAQLIIIEISKCHTRFIGDENTELLEELDSYSKLIRTGLEELSHLEESLSRKSIDLYCKILQQNITGISGYNSIELQKETEELKQFISAQRDGIILDKETGIPSLNALRLIPSISMFYEDHLDHFLNFKLKKMGRNV